MAKVHPEITETSLSSTRHTNYGSTQSESRGQDKTTVKRKRNQLAIKHLELKEMGFLAMERLKKMWVFVGVALGLVVVLACVTVALLATGKGDQHLMQRRQSSSSALVANTDAITFEDFLSGEFTAKFFNGSWWSDTELQWKDQAGNLVSWNIESHETTVIVSQDLLASVSEGAQFVGFSPDNRLILFSYDVRPVWRHSYTAKYLVLDTVANKSTQVTAVGGGDTLQYCAWVPNTDNNNTLLYVYQNNIYWRPDAAVGSPANDIIITTDGKIDQVFNGIPDWVYEEEVLGDNKAHYVSPDGRKLAFVQFNDTLVPEFRYPVYGEPNNIYDAQYPEYKIVRYPKSGETNPTVRVFVRDVADSANKEVEPPQEVLVWGEFILTVITWVDVKTISITWMNRIQNESTISLCSEAPPTRWSCRAIFSHQQPRGWIEIAPPPLFSRDGTSFLAILPSLQPASARTYKHIWRQDVVSGQQTMLTAGEFVVTDILSWDEARQAVFFIGTSSEGPGARHLYSTTNGSVACLTCEIRTSRGEECKRNGVLINSKNTHYVHTCGGLGIPEVGLRKLDDGSLLYLLQDNEVLAGKLTSKVLPTRLDTMIEVADGFLAPVKLLLPPHMQEGVQYPLIVYVYGGPGSQMVDDRWSVGWGDYLATSRNIVYASIDGRGTGFQSDEYLFKVYRNLGSVEMEDQIAVTRKLVSMFGYLDATRTAIWGWSYGGFATLMTLEQDVGPAPVFSCGISVAPVTSWLLYDSIYTERYMALPSDNSQGYNHSAIEGIENLRAKQWMLNHGVADDNVHYQHSMLLTRALEEKDIQFVQHSYPDENHGLGGVSRFLYHAMNNFWTECFDLPQLP